MQRALVRAIDFFTRNRSMPNSVKDALRRFGNVPVVGITICRKPIASNIRKVLDAVKGRGVEAELRRANYDDLYHLFMVVRLANGASLRLEKNERVHISPGGEEGESVNVSVPPGLFLNLMIKRAVDRVGLQQFLRYSARYNNCQDFVLNMLLSNGLSGAEAEQFVKQDLEQLVFNGDLSELLSKGMDVLTDVAAGIGEAVDDADLPKPAKQVLHGLLEKVGITTHNWGEKTGDVAFNWAEKRVQRDADIPAADAPEPTADVELPADENNISA